MTAAIDIRDVNVSYGAVPALDHVSLSIEPGRVCGLIGVNGAGKSTLLKTLIGLQQPLSGSVRIAGVTTKQARREGLITYVPQSETVDWEFPLDVRSVVAMGLYGRLGPTRRLRAVHKNRVDEALERVGLTDLAHRQIGQLSGGQRKRAFVARSLAHDASVLLLDEPLAGVDADTAAALTGVFGSLAAEGRTILVATHDLHGLPRWCDEAALLMRRIVVHDDPAVVTRPENLARAFGGGAA